jgi:hypothetical protein
MTELLKFLVRYCSPLFDNHQFEITDSKNSKEESYIQLRNTELGILLKKKPKNLPEISFQSLFEKKTRTWFPLDQISTLLKRPTNQHKLDEANTAFLLTHITAIVKLFSKENTPKTIQALNKIQNKTA